MINYIKSPMNYMGGKYSLLHNIFSILPEKSENFVDLFAGGLNVGINANAKTIFVNDQIKYIIELYEFFSKNSIPYILSSIENRIAEFKLSVDNNEGYIAFRNYYNKNKNILDLFILTCYSFNHQIRFNAKHEFNTPFGKNRSCYNESIKKNLIKFCESLQSKNFIFSACDFRQFDFSCLKPNDVVYCDPPYLITTGSYNDGKRGFNDWGANEEKALLTLLDELNEKGIIFVLSNVFTHKGNNNNLLIEWSEKYNVHYLNKSYKNCNYQIKDKNSITIEVLVTNAGVSNGN